VTPNPGFKVTVYLEVERTLIGNHTRSTEWYNFLTSDPNFKVTTFFDIEYLRNNTR